MSLLPTAPEERWLLLAMRLGLRGHSPAVQAGTGGWRTIGWVPRCAFFILGFILAVATCGILFTLFGSDFWLGAGIVLWGTGEGLIAKRRVHAAGLEEALIATGLALTAFGITEALGPMESEASVFAVGIGLAVAGSRLLNPLITTLAALILSLSVAQWVEFPLLGSGRAGFSAVLWTSLFCYGSGAAAMLLGGRMIERPSVDRMLDWLVVVMPVAGYGWLQLGNNYSEAVTPVEVATLVVPLLFASAAFVTGLRRRTHAPLLAGLVGITCSGHAILEMSDVATSLLLILGGSAALTGAALLDRKLSLAREGLTSTRLDDSTALDLVEAAGAALLPPVQRPAGAPEVFDPGGGGYGGGGASGRY